MKILQIVLADLIRNGKVTVETPDLDMDELRKVVENRAEQKLREIAGIVFEEEKTDGEKVRYLQELLGD